MTEPARALWALRRWCSPWLQDRPGVAVWVAVPLVTLVTLRAEWVLADIAVLRERRGDQDAPMTEPSPHHLAHQSGHPWPASPGGPLTKPAHQTETRRSERAWSLTGPQPKSSRRFVGRLADTPTTGSAPSHRDGERGPSPPVERSVEPRVRVYPATQSR